MISFADTPQSKEAPQARKFTDPSAGAPPSRRSGYNAPFIDKDHWNKVFTEPEYFASIAKQKGMAEGAKVSLFGDDYVYRQAMIGYMADTRNVPVEDMRAIFDAEKDGFAQKMLGKPTASARELFDWHKADYERRNQKEAAARQVLENVVTTSLRDAWSGGDTPFVETVAQSIEAAGDLLDDEDKSRLWEKAEELDMKVRATQAQVAPEARFIFDALQQYSGQTQAMGAPDMREVAGKFAQLPDNQRRAIYELVGGFAQLQKVDKGFWYQMAESLGRGGSDIAERVPRNLKEQTLRGNLRLLASEQPVFAATNLDGSPGYSAAGNTPMTPEEREQAKAEIQDQLGVLKVERELRDLAERVVDPIKTVTFLPEIVEEGLYGAARSLPYTAVAAVPYVGVPAVAAALYSANYDSIMLEYPDLDPDKAALIAAISAPIEAGLERMKVNTITGRLPIFGGLVKRLQHPNQRNITRIAIGGAGILAEQNAQEIIQNATFPFIQTVAAALDEDLPGYDWAKRLEGMPRELAVQFVALLPLSLMGVGALSYREISRGESYLRSKSNLERAGYGPEQIDRITGAATAEEAQSLLQEERDKRDPEAVKAAAQRVIDEVLALRQQKNPAVLPRLDKQGADYVVTSPDSRVLARTTDQTAAEQALLSAQRETVQREMRDVHTGINEAVEFIKKVNEARQRGEDIAKVIREQAPRTLLTDYEANPTQENLDRLFETVRAFGQEINEPAELANFPVLGSNQGALREGIWRSIIRINDGADGNIVMREFAQDNLKRAVAEGRVTMDWVREQLNDILPQIDSDRIQRQLRTETDTDVIEAFSDVAVAYFRGQIKDEQIPAGLRGIIRRLAIITRDIFRRAYNLARLRAEGKLDRDFEALLAEAVGVDQQALVDRSRQKAEQDMRGPDGLTDEERAALEAEWLADQEAEAQESVGANAIDILDAVRQAGGLPTPTSKHARQYVGELKMLRETLRGGRNVGVKGAFNLFRKNTLNLDFLIKELQASGFRDLETPNDLFELLDRRIRLGRPIYGYEGMAWAEAYETRGHYSIVVTPQQDADYLAAVERGDMETAQRMVGEAARAAGYKTPAAHGSSAEKEFTVFDTETSPYGRVQGSYFTKNTSGMWSGWMKNRRLMRVYLRFNNPATEQTLREMGYKLSGKAARRWLTDRGYDGVVDDSMDEVVAFSPEQIKSADPVTYDAQGNVIPLSRRFDLTTPNINYSIGSRAQPDVERNVINLPEVTISGPANYSIAAWHGTPHEVDKFSTEKIGTGEGAQAYGWGIYFAQNPKVAEEYRAKLVADLRATNDGIFDIAKLEHLNVRAAARRSLKEAAELAQQISQSESPMAVAAQRDLNALRKAQDAEASDYAGNLYNVSLDVEPEDLLDWDNPLSEQSEKVRSAIQSFMHSRNTVKERDTVFAEYDAGVISKEERNKRLEEIPTRSIQLSDVGATIYQRLWQNQVTNGREASATLLSAGIKGIRYLDQGSRAFQVVLYINGQEYSRNSFDRQNQAESYAEDKRAEGFTAEIQRDGTYNYVIFDDSLIKITGRNGKPVSIEQAAKETANYSIGAAQEQRRANVAITPETPVAESIDGVPRDEIFASAKRRFGITKSLYEAGYVLPDGTMLDFSGRADAGYVRGDDLIFRPRAKEQDYMKDSRGVDHREIEWDGVPAYSEIWASMVDFLRLGAIRIDGNSGMISMHSRARPTSSQMRVLKDLVVAADGAYVDLEDDLGNKTAMMLESGKWPRVQGLMERWANGETPAVTQNYSIGMPPERIAPIAINFPTPNIPSDLKNLRHYIRRMIAETLQGKSVVIARSGTEVKFTAESKAESVSKARTATQAAPMLEAEQIVLHGIPVDISEPDPDKKTYAGTRVFRRFAVPVAIEDKVYASHFTVREPNDFDTNKGVFYEFNLGNKMEPRDMGLPPAFASRPSEDGTPFDLGSEISVASLINKVKSSDKPAQQALVLESFNYSIGTPRDIARVQAATAKRHLEARLKELQAGEPSPVDTDKTFWLIASSTGDIASILDNEQDATTHFQTMASAGEWLWEYKDGLRTKVPLLKRGVAERRADGYIDTVRQEQESVGRVFYSGADTSAETATSAGEIPSHTPDGRIWEGQEQPVVYHGGRLFDPQGTDQGGYGQTQTLKPRRPYQTYLYSISTQREIDRVQAAMGAMNRSPLSRLKVYEKMQERFLRVMADNRETLAAMEGGDLSQVRRTQILQALGELDGIITALPAEIRSKIGGYTQLAKIDPMDVYKGNEKVSEARGMSGAIISAWMREGLNIGEAQKKTELPAGYRAERNLDPTRADRAIADVFIQRINRINEVLENFLRDEYNDAAVELFKRAKPQRSGAGEKPKGKLGADVHELFATLQDATEWTSEEAQAWADGQWARIESGELSPYEEAHASLAAQVIPLFADWANADSTQRAAAVTMGKDILDRAYKGERNRIIAQRTKRGYDRTDLSDDAGVAASDDKARQTALKKENSLPSKFESGMLNLLNFDQVLRYIFGNDSKIARQISDRQRKADNAKSDDIAALSDQWDTFLTMLGGGQMEGQQLLFDLSRMNEEIDGVPYSQNQLIAITMMWMQPKGRQHMEGFLDEDGQPWHYNQDFVNKAEKLLRPEAKAIRQYLLRKYDEEYDAINKVYRKVYGLNLPKNQFYSPLVVESINAPAQGGVDPVTGAVFSAGATSPSALRSRGGAIAQPVFRDAVQTYFGHMLQMAHWKAYAEFNSEVSALLGHRDTRNVVKGKAGEQAATVLNNWLDYFRQGGNKDAANHLALNQWINRITGNFAAISLFGRLSTLALQVTQLGAASAKMPVGAYLSRFGKLMSGRLKWTTALDSDYIQRRIKDMPPAVALAMQGLRAEKPNAIRNAARWLGQHLSSFDGFFTAGTYAIVYDYQLSQATKNGMGGQEAADYAREATERIVDEIAQPTRAGARSIYELNSTNPVARAVWAFSSESRKNMGLLMYSGAKGGGRNFGKALTYVLLLNGLVGIVIRNAFRDMRDDDDDEIFDEKNWGWSRLAAQFISDPIYGIPVVGETAETAIYAALGVYRPTGPVFDVTGGVPAVKRLAYDHPMALLEGDAEFREIVRDVNRVLASAGLFNSTIAGAASISNLAKDIYEVGDAQVFGE